MTGKIPDGLRFSTSKDRTWRGNGFGTDSAVWFAEFKGVRVGEWHRPASGLPTVTVGGLRHLAIHHQEWRTAVIEYVNELIQLKGTVTDDPTTGLPIFVDPPAHNDRPDSNYVANPLRVFRPDDPKNPARIDLIALANVILQCESRQKVEISLASSLRADLVRIEARMTRLESTIGSLPSGKLARILSAVDEILNDEDEEEYRD